jgi:drug/metabolite transporter (DMT)-like permease
LDEHPRLNPYFALVLGVGAVSTGAIFARLADAPALVIAAYRVGLAMLVLVPLAAIRARQELLTLKARDVGLLFLAGLFLAAHFATWISSLDYTAVANSVVLVNTNPLWVALLSPLITKESLRPTTIVSVLITMAGAAIIGAGDMATGAQAIKGDLLALAGGLCAAFYILLGRQLRQRLSLIAYISMCYGSAALFLWAWVLMLKLPISGFDGSTWAALWAMALFTHLVGHSCYNWALRWFSASLIAVSLLGEPIGSTILAYFIFHEGLTLWKLIGGVLILGGIYIAARQEHSPG